MVGMYEKFNALHNQQKVGIFLIGFVTVYIYTQGGKQAMNTFFAVVFGVTYYLIQMKASSSKREISQTINIYISNLEKTVISHKSQAMVLEHVFKVHKPLKSLVFIKSNTEVCEILYELRFMDTYDKETFIDFVVCFEYFLKIHYNMIIGKYDVVTNFSILRDIRHELLNTLQAVHFTIPNISTVFDSTNLDKDLKHAIMRVQAFTFRYTRVLYNKFKNELPHENYHGYFGIDNGKNDKFHLY